MNISICECCLSAAVHNPEEIIKAFSTICIEVEKALIGLDLWRNLGRLPTGRSRFAMQCSCLTVPGAPLQSPKFPSSVENGHRFGPEKSSDFGIPWHDDFAGSHALEDFFTSGDPFSPIFPLRESKGVKTFAPKGAVACHAGRLPPPRKGDSACQATLSRTGPEKLSKLRVGPASC